jgi:hypothetical protein
MGQFQGFAKIMEDQIRRQIASENNVKTKTFSKPETLEEIKNLSWMMSNIPRFSLGKSQIENARTKYDIKLRPRPNHVFSSKAQEAFDFFSKLPRTLTPNFDFQELKSCFRINAHSLHPDKGGSAESYIQLRNAYESLYSYLNR